MTSFSFILSNDFLSNNNNESETSLLTTSDAQASTNSSILAPSCENGSGIDAFGGKDIFGTCDFSNMSEGTFFTAINNSSVETAGSMAYTGAETAGSMACAGAETAGSMASAGGASFGGGFSGGSVSCGGGFVC